MTPDQQAREFLSRLYDWNERDGHKAIWYGWYKVGETKPIFFGTIAETLNKAVSLVNYGVRKKHDTYVCMSSQAEAGEAKDTVVRAKKSAQHAVSLKSFWLDVDVKEGGYATNEVAAMGIAEFTRKVNLPKPSFIVHTGGGFHFHWMLHGTVDLYEWRPVAEALKAAAVDHMLPIDTAVIADPARIMRMPGTVNFKNGMERPSRIVGTPGPDYALGRLEQALQPWRGPTLNYRSVPPVSGLGAPSGLFSGPSEDLSEGVHLSEARSKPVDMEVVTRECPLYADALAKGGMDHEEATWSLEILGATFAPEDIGREWAHKISERWANAKGDSYDPAAVDDKYDEKVRAKELNPRLSWPACITFAGSTPYASSICTTCPHLQTPKMSPLKLGVNDADLPEGYSRSNGWICRKVANEGGDIIDVPVLRAGMRDVYIEEQAEDTLLHAHVVLPRNVRKITLDGNTVSNMHETAKAFSRIGAGPTEPEKRWLRELIVAWIRHLQERKGTVKHTAAYGWHMKATKPSGFAYDGKVYSAGKSRPEPTSRPDEELRKIYSLSGDMAEWRKAADFITGMGRPELDAILAASFGAPLMVFSGQKGAIMSAQSQASGVGKSSAMRVGQAVWGQPTKGMFQLNDTTNLVMRRAGKLRNLPLFWDEVKGRDQVQMFTQAAFQLAQGRDKGRLQANLNEQNAGEWETLLVVASNERVAAHVSQDKGSPAGMVRVLEYEVPAYPQTMSPLSASELVGKVDRNYGHAGLAYTEWLGSNAGVAEQVYQFVRGHIEQRLSPQPQQEERYWIVAASVVAAGASIADKIGLAKFDVPMLMDFLIDTIEKNRSVKKESTSDLGSPTAAADLLRAFLANMTRDTIWTDDYAVGRAKVNLDPDHAMPNAPPNGTRVQFAMVPNRVRFSVSALEQWCAERKMMPTTLLDAWHRHFAAARIRVTLGAGTVYTTCMQDTVIEIDLASVP